MLRHLGWLWIAGLGIIVGIGCKHAPSQPKNQSLDDGGGPPKHTNLLPPGPRTQLKLADLPPEGLNASVFRSGFALQAPDEWTLFTQGGFLSVLNSIDPNIQGGMFDIMSESQLVLWHATKEATTYMAPVDLRIDHFTTTDEASLEGYVNWHLSKRDENWKDIGRVNTPIGPVQHLLRYYDRTNYRQVKVPYAMDTYLFVAPHDMFRLSFRIPSARRSLYLPVIEAMVSSFRVFKPVSDRADVYPDYRIKGDRFITQGDAIAEARAAQRERTTLDEVDRVNAMNAAGQRMRDEAAARSQPPTPGGPPPSGPPDTPPVSNNPPGTTDPGQNLPPPTTTTG